MKRVIFANVLAETEHDATTVLYAVYGKVAFMIEPIPSPIGGPYRFKITIETTEPEVQ